MKKLIITILLLSLSSPSFSQLSYPPGYSPTCRSYSVKKRFDRQQGYPKGRPGYIVDHICALANGGLDITSNMQYQTKIESDLKDKIENTPKGRILFCTPLNSLPYRTIKNC